MNKKGYEQIILKNDEGLKDIYSNSDTNVTAIKGITEIQNDTSTPEEIAIRRALLVGLFEREIKPIISQIDV